MCSQSFFFFAKKKSSIAVATSIFKHFLRKSQFSCSRNIFHFKIPLNYSKSPFLFRPTREYSGIFGSMPIQMPFSSAWLTWWMQQQSDSSNFTVTSLIPLCLFTIVSHRHVCKVTRIKIFWLLIISAIQKKISRKANERTNEKE